MQDQHNRLYKQYKDFKTMDEAESRDLAIRAWWLFSGAASENAIRDLNLWLAFWHFRYRQWSGCMQMVSPSSLAYLVIQSHIRLHNWTMKSILFFLLFQGLSLEEMAEMPSCNLSETAHNKWLQQSSNRGNDLFATTCDDKIRAVIQMTNYRAYLKGKASGTGPSKQELKPDVAVIQRRLKRRSTSFQGWRWPPPGSRIWRAKRSLAARSESWTSHQVMMVTLIDLTRSTSHSLECRPGLEPPLQNL
jgi:hypothetical protein